MSLRDLYRQAIRPQQTDRIVLAYGKACHDVIAGTGGPYSAEAIARARRDLGRLRDRETAENIALAVEAQNPNQASTSLQDAALITRCRLVIVALAGGTAA